jgi:hypothetical protein
MITSGGLFTVGVALVDIVAVGLNELVAEELVLNVLVPLLVLDETILTVGLVDFDIVPDVVAEDVAVGEPEFVDVIVGEHEFVVVAVVEPDLLDVGVTELD